MVDRDKEWLYKLNNGKIGILLILVMVVPFTLLTLWLYKSGNGAFIFAGFIDLLFIFVFILTLVRYFSFRVYINESEIYYQNRLKGGQSYRFSMIRSVWVASGRNGNTCIFKLKDGEVIRFPFYNQDSEAIAYFKNKVDVRNRLLNEEIELDNYEITGKNDGKSYIVGAFVILVILFVLEFFQSKVTNFNDPFVFKFISIAMGIASVIILIVRYKYLLVKMDRVGFVFQTTPFNKRYYKYSDIVSCYEKTKVVRTGRFDAGSSHFYYDYFVFVDKSGKSVAFQYEKHLYSYEIYILKKRIEEANGRSVEAYVEDDSIEEIQLKNLDAVDETIERRSKGKSRLMMLIIFVIFVLFGVKAFWPMIENHPSVSSVMMDHLEVRELLEENGYNTIDMPTTYWYLDEEKLSFVTAGEKDTSKIEFYEYGSSETIMSVYNKISYDFNQEIDAQERKEYERDLGDDGKIFEIQDEGEKQVVAFKNHLLVYGRSEVENYNEIMQLIEQMGFK